MEYVNELDTISARAAQKDAALKVHRLTFMEATMMVVGSTIGSGVLGLAFASRNAGWPVLLTWLVVAGFFSIISMLYVAEATLRTTKPLQLSGLAEKYVGKIGSWLIFFSVGATSFCSLIAYTSGCGRILSEFFGISLEMASCLFALGATSVVWLGLKATGVAEKYLSYSSRRRVTVFGPRTCRRYSLRPLDLCCTGLQYRRLLLCRPVYRSGNLPGLHA